jgi:hypothetical protein
VQEPILIALHGARGAGKDTTFRFIQRWCAKSDPALSAVRGSFADRVKWAYMSHNPEGWRGNFLVPPRTPEEDPYSFAHFAVITDMRADNEMQRVTELGGIKVKIRRRNAERAERTYYEKKGIERHLFASELPDEEFDVVLVNDDNNLDNAYVRTDLLMHEINYNGIASIKRGVPLPWVIL